MGKIKTAGSKVRLGQRDENFTVTLKSGGHEQAEFILAVTHWLEHHEKVVSERQFFWRIEKSFDVLCWGRNNRQKRELAVLCAGSGDFVRIHGYTSDFEVKDHEELVRLLESMAKIFACKFKQDHAILTLGGTTWVVNV